ncbi:hypothetical protein B0H15DRAFT_822806 [Mycena belliarum]|uniref:Uncharacterized protein n=1 Tax=Mycena belliarum TaxID=1033014 RepID=A0AAD6UDM2_9AGAR|nr:hypothetical protein B0H15DRAFT_822806 [Mycena belliae]
MALILSVWTKASCHSTIMCMFIPPCPGQIYIQLSLVLPFRTLTYTAPHHASFRSSHEPIQIGGQKMADIVVYLERMS